MLPVYLTSMNCKESIHGRVRGISRERVWRRGRRMERSRVRKEKDTGVV